MASFKDLKTDGSKRICKVSDVTNLSVIPVDNPDKVLPLLPLEQFEEQSGGVGRGEPVEHLEGAEDGGDAGVVARVHVQQLRLFLHNVVHHLGIWILSCLFQT